MNWHVDQTGRTLIIVTCFLVLVSIFRLGSWGVIESSEARYAEISREMFVSEDWIHPTLLGIHHYHKPPVTYWLTAVGYEIFGVNPFGARILLVVSYALQIFFVYRITQLILKDDKVSFYAAIIYSSFPMVITSVRGLTADAYLNTFVLASIVSWLNWRASSKVFWLYLVALLLALAFLTKGPVALLIPLMLFLGLDRSLNFARHPLTRHHVLAGIVFIIVAGSWFVILVYKNKLFIDYFLFTHTIDRYVQAEVFSRTRAWWYYAAYAPPLALPWTVLLFYKSWSFKKNRIPGVVKRIAAFWILLPLIFFSISSSKLILYILPVFSGLAIVCAWCLRVMPTSSLKSFEKIIFTWSVLLCVTLPSLSYFLHYTISAGLIILTLIFAITLALMKARKIFEADQKVLLYSISLSGFLIVFSSLFISLNELKLNSTEPIADWIRKNGMKDHQVIVYDQLLPSLAFALEKDIVSVSNGNRNLNREVQFEKNSKWKDLLISLKDDSKITLDTLLTRPSVIVAKGKPDNSVFITGKLSEKKEIGKWTLYLNSE